MSRPGSIAIGVLMLGTCAGTSWALEPTFSRLRPGCRFESRHNPFPELWLACGRHAHPVVGRESLKGYVAIQNAAQAMEFARLFTVPGTELYGVPEKFVEVSAGPAVDRYAFVVPRFDFAQCCVAPTAVRAGGSEAEPRFDVRRTVVHKPDYAVYVLTETVSHDGEVVRKEMRTLNVDGRTLGLFVTLPAP